jgi:GTPase SAR1 family protein
MKTYRIIVLGASGSGKTFFLAAMYKKLSLQKPDIGFFLEVAPEQRIKLINKYDEIARPDADWPHGTLRNEISTWTFSCTIQSLQGNFPAFNVMYLDYSGEILNQVQQTTDADSPLLKIDQEAKQADALLVLLDGQKLLYVMQKQQQAFARLERDLNYILPIVQTVRPLPVHFVITKWDLLKRQGITLNQVRELLLQIDQFNNILSQRRALQIPTRLIPTSALGQHFAELDPSGMMRKNPQQTPDPYQVEMPMACTLIDSFQLLLNDLRRDQSSLSFLVRTLVVETLKVVFFLLELLPVGTVPILGVLFKIMGKGVQRSAEILKQDQAVSLELVHNRQTAVESAVKSCNFLMAKLEVEFPESNLV